MLRGVTDIAALICLAGLLRCINAASNSYSVKTLYQGNNFFGQWNFSTDVDVNYGNVAFQNYHTAVSQRLVYIDTDGTAVIKIDNTTVGNPADTTFGRASVRMLSNESVEAGSLVLMDVVHVPYGCSVWPAFFMQGYNVTWPSGGEIDIFENVNKATTNQYSLHTMQGCMHPNTDAGETGKLVSTDCYNATSGNQGCIVQETKENNFGDAFNNNGGGAFAMEYNSDAISIWFFPRGSVPSDFNNSSPDPSNWGDPSAYYPSSSCDISQFFKPQQMILNIDICGAFALGTFEQTCSGSCLDLVRTPTNYDDAYFKINYIKVLTQGQNDDSGGSGNGGDSGSNNNTGTTGGGDNGAGLALSSPLPTGSMLVVLSLLLLFGSSILLE